MRSLALLALLPALALADPQQRVLVVSFQSLGVEPEVMNRVGDSLRTESTAASWTALDGAETQKVLRAATMCGEDAECLATLGQRADARWVLAWGFGKVGSSFLFTALVVETPTSAKLASFSEKLPGVPGDAAPLARRAVSALFKDVKRPLIVEPPPPPPVPVTPERRFVTPSIVAVSIAGAATIATVIFGALAATNYPKLTTALSSDRPSLDATQRRWNLAADASLGLAVVSGATALILFLLGAPPAEAK